MTTVRIAAAQTLEYREDIEAAVAAMQDFAARADAEGARLLVFPEGFLQGYLTEETAARRVALSCGRRCCRRLRSGSRRYGRRSFSG